MVLLGLGRFCVTVTRTCHCMPEAPPSGPTLWQTKTPYSTTTTSPIDRYVGNVHLPMEITYIRMHLIGQPIIPTTNLRHLKLWEEYFLRHDSSSITSHGWRRGSLSKDSQNAPMVVSVYAYMYICMCVGVCVYMCM